MSSSLILPKIGDAVELQALNIKFSPASLTFGVEAGLFPVNRTVSQELVLKNTQSSDICVSICPSVDAESSWKCETTLDHPDPFVVKAGSEETITMKLKIMCTTKLMLKVSLKTWYSGVSWFKEATINIPVTSQESTSIDPDELKNDQDEKGRKIELGRGGFGVVYSGTYRGRKVAIKIPMNRDFFLPEEEKDFDREVEMMETWQHEAIVEFIGAVKIPGKQMIVTELCSHGSLDKAMKNNPEVFNEIMKVKCLLDTSNAMNYLHNNHIMHRDLKPQNLLVASLEWKDAVVVKLTDFGTSRAERRMNTMMTKGVGTDAYMAPEVLQGLKTYDKSIDVYSFSMLMYTIFSGRTAFEDADISEGGFPFVQIVAGKRPSVPPSCTEDIGKLMQQCWNGNPSERPGFGEIHDFFVRYFLECRYGKETTASIIGMKLDTREELSWSKGGGPLFEELCELLKKNAIPTKILEFRGNVTSISFFFLEMRYIIEMCDEKRGIWEEKNCIF